MKQSEGLKRERGEEEFRDFTKSLGEVGKKSTKCRALNQGKEGENRIGKQQKNAYQKNKKAKEKQEKK